MLERGGGGKKTQRAAWREEGARAEGGDGNTRKTSSGRDMGEERPRGNGEKIRGGATEGWPGAGGRERHGDGALGALGAAAWDHSGGQNGAEQPGRTRKEGKILEKRGGLGTREAEAAQPHQDPLTQHPSCPQCAAHKLCHPEELVLLGHALGIPQAPLSSCSSQALQLVSFWTGGGR